MERRTVITLGIVAVLICTILIGTVIYLKNIHPTNQVINSNPGQMIITSPSPSPSVTPQTHDSSNKIYTGVGFTISYPASWGILTCTNSKNIEFDPNEADVNVKCDVAQKPISVMVGQSTCSGGTEIVLGRNTVSKVVTDFGSGYIKYNWCVAGSTPLDITERVSQGGERATSKTDYSTEVERIISNIMFGGAS